MKDLQADFKKDTEKEVMGARSHHLHSYGCFRYSPEKKASQNGWMFMSSLCGKDGHGGREC